MNNGTNNIINQQTDSNELSTNNPDTFLNTINSEIINNYIINNTLLNNTGNTRNIELNMENINRFSNILNFDPNESSPSARYLALQQQQQQQQHCSNHPHSHAHEQDQSFVMNMPNSVGNNSEVNIEEATDQNESYDEQNNNQNNNIFRMALLALQTNLPIILILFIKVFHQHIIGFLIVLAFLATLHWSNRFLINQVELKERKNNLKLLILIAFLIGNISLFFFAFDSYQLQYCLIFLETNIKNMDIWNLIWVVVCCDIIAKLMTICLKSFVTLLPCRYVPIRKRGHYYSNVELIGLLYRSLLPIHPWILFLLYSKNNSTDLINEITTQEEQSYSMFPLILCIVYIIVKLNHLYTRYLELSQSICELLRDQSYGIPAIINDDNAVCPICQDKYSNPVQLKCKHVFCQDCVTIWLDREQTCPMCRAKVSSKKPTYKDGSTGIFIQWY